MNYTPAAIELLVAAVDRHRARMRLELIGDLRAAAPADQKLARKQDAYTRALERTARRG